MIIAIDGPAAAGKGTLAKRLANHYGFLHLDTGLLYRAVGKQVLESNQDPEDSSSAAAAVQKIDVSQLDAASLRSEAVGVAASQVAAIPEVRALLLDFQRRIAREGEGAVLDGRDIGTVVCPDADVKLFITATDSARAERRCAELRNKGIQADFDRMLTEIQKRDERDSNRAAAPLKKAADAHLIDTSDMDIGAVFKKAVEIVDSCAKLL